MRYRKKGATLLAILALAAAGVFPSSKGPEPANTSVPFQLLRGHLMVVEGTIGQLSGRRMVFDTGSSPTILDVAIARQLALEGPASRLEMFNGNSLTQAGVLPALTMGPVTAKSLPVLIADLSFVQRDVGIRIDAIIGLDVIRTSFVIDYDAKVIRFGPLPTLPESVPFETAPPLITVRMEVQGHPAHVLVDTGASGLLLFRKEHRFDLLSAIRIQTANNISGAFQREQVEISDVRLGELDLGRRTAYLANAKESVSRDYDGLMGIPALGIKQIAFNFERGVISWK